MLNNLDTLRSYGSAGDELENFPPDYVRNLNRSTPQGCASNNCDTEKSTWAEQMHLASTLMDNKTKMKNGMYKITLQHIFSSMFDVSDYKVSSPVNSDVPNRLYGGRSNTINNMKINGTINSDDDPRNMGCK